MSESDGSGPPSMGIPQPPEAGLQATVMYDIRPTAPPMVPLHPLPAETKPQKRKRPSVSWTQTMDKELISLYHSARADSPMKAQGNLARGHWSKIAFIIGTHFNLTLKGQQARSRFGILKRKQSLWTKLKEKPGFHLHNDEITAHPSDWAAVCQEDQEYGQFKGRPYPYGESMMQALYGSTELVKPISDIFCSMDTSASQQRQAARNFGYEAPHSDFMHDYRMIQQQNSPFEQNPSAILHSELAKMFEGTAGLSKEMQDALHEEQSMACMKAIELSDLEERRLAATLLAYQNTTLRLACMERVLGMTFNSLRDVLKTSDGDVVEADSGGEGPATRDTDFTHQGSILGKREGSPLTGLISSASPSQLKKPRQV